MNGFKDGASSDDPFGGDDDDTEDDSEAAVEGGASVATDVDDHRGGREASEPAESTASAGGASGGLPWLYQRSSITDGREKTVQLHLQSSSLDEQRDAVATVESRLGESVNKADLREAAFLVGLDHLDEVESILRGWGYDAE